MASAGSRKFRASPSTVILPVGAALQPEERARKLGLAGAHQPEDAEDLALAQREGDAAQPPARRQGPRPRAPASPSATAVFGNCSDRRRPTIMPISVASSASFAGKRADDAAVAQHGDAIGDERHLRQVVRDVDDADAALLEPAR